MLAVVLSLYFQDFYSSGRIRSRILLVEKTIRTIAIVFFSQALMAYAAPTLLMPRWTILAGSTVLLFALPAWRLTFSTIFSRAFSAATHSVSRIEYGRAGDCAAIIRPAGAWDVRTRIPG